MKKIMTIAAVLFAATAVASVALPKIIDFKMEDNSNVTIHSYNVANIGKIDLTSPTRQIIYGTDNATVLSSVLIDSLTDKKFYPVLNDSTFFNGSFRTDSWHYMLFPSDEAFISELVPANTVMKVKLADAGTNLQVLADGSTTALEGTPGVTQPTEGGAYIASSGAVQDSAYEFKLSANDLSALDASKGLVIGGENATIKSVGLASDVIWTGDDVSYSDWGSNTAADATTDPFNLKTLKAGDKVTFHIQAIDSDSKGYVNFQIMKNATGQNSFDCFKSKNAGTEGTNVYWNVLGSSLIVSDTVTTADVASLAEGYMVSAGDGTVKVKFITVEHKSNSSTTPTTNTPVTIYSGSFALGNWDSDLSINVPSGFEFKAGDTIAINSTLAGDDQVKAAISSPWTVLYENYSMTSSPASFTITADQATALNAAHLYLQGKNATVTSVVVTHAE
jgi:Cu/Ag efflux protein CusF